MKKELARDRLNRLMKCDIYCKCGCGGKIVIKESHLYRDIPEYIVGHSSRNQAIKSSRLNKINEKFKTGKLKPWNKGLTKLTDKRVMANCNKLHKKVIEKYKNGELVPWNKGKKYKNKNYPKERKLPTLTKEQRKFKKDSFTGDKNPNFNTKKSEFQKYKIKCKFNFDMGKYPEEFRLEYIKDMFHPTKNKEGYTRDHVFSIYEGFVQNIDTKLISHPANCNLLLHRENSRKNKFINITKGDLINNIKIWEDKYGIY